MTYGPKGNSHNRRQFMGLAGVAALGGATASLTGASQAASSQPGKADLIVINKTDLLDAPKLDRLKQALAAKYPQAQIVAIRLAIETGTPIDDADGGRPGSQRNGGCDAS